MFGVNGNTRGWATAVALLAATFFAGAMSAVAVVRLTRPPVPERVEWRGPADDPPAGRPGRGGPDGPWGFDGQGERFLGLLTDRLSLTPEQRDRIREILAEREATARQSMREARERLAAMMAETDREVRAVLTPEQQEAFDRLQQEGRERLRGRFRGEGRRGGPPPPDGRPPDRRPPS